MNVLEQMMQKVPGVVVLTGNSAKEETKHIRPQGCICDPFDLAAMGHMTNCPCHGQERPR